MAYKKSYSKKPMYRRKKTVSKPTVSSAVKKYVKRTIAPMKPEVKRTIDYYTEQLVDAVVTPYSIYEPFFGQGAAHPQRTGNQIRIIGLKIKAFFRNNTTTTQLIRALVLSTSSDTVTTVATMELFQDAGISGTTTTIAASGTSAVNMLYPINKSKFKIHYDHVFKLGGSGSTDGKDVQLFNRFNKFNSVIKFDGTSTGGVGDASKRFFVIYLTSDPLLDGGGGAVEISGTNHWYFTDC